MIENINTINWLFFFCFYLALYRFCFYIITTQILRDYLKLIFSVWLSVSTLINSTEGERWSRQVSNSEWIPLAHPRSQIPQSSVSNNQAPPLPSIQALNLPPALRQEYQQQLHQLQRTQESIHKLLHLQQQLRSQQQLLQVLIFIVNIKLN